MLHEPREKMTYSELHNKYLTDNRCEVDFQTYYGFVGFYIGDELVASITMDDKTRMYEVVLDSRISKFKGDRERQKIDKFLQRIEGFQSAYLLRIQSWLINSWSEVIIDLAEFDYNAKQKRSNENASRN